MFGWLHSTKGGDGVGDVKSAGDEKFDRAMAEATDLMVKARSVRSQLEPYKHDGDPFAAIQRATALEGFYK